MSEIKSCDNDTSNPLYYRVDNAERGGFLKFIKFFKKISIIKTEG